MRVPLGTNNPLDSLNETRDVRTNDAIDIDRLSGSHQTKFAEDTH